MLLPRCLLVIPQCRTLHLMVFSRIRCCYTLPALMAPGMPTWLVHYETQYWNHIQALVTLVRLENEMVVGYRLQDCGHHLLHLLLLMWLGWLEVDQVKVMSGLMGHCHGMSMTIGDGYWNYWQAILQKSCVEMIRLNCYAQMVHSTSNKKCICSIGNETLTKPIQI